MPLFKKILIAVDGSSYSQIAADYAFALAAKPGVAIDGQHVLDPRLINLFVNREFAEELGFGQSIETSEKVFKALKKISTVILELFTKEAHKRGFEPQTFLDIGYIVEEIVKRSQGYELLILGHCRGEHKPAASLITGSVAERVACEADCPVLITVKPMDSIKQLLVGFDGSEPSKGALLMAEQLALMLGKPLKALTVCRDEKHKTEAKLTIEQGKGYLREAHDSDVFNIEQGPPASTLIEYANQTDSLLVLGAYGFNRPEETVLGSTTTYVLRRTKTSLLIVR